MATRSAATKPDKDAPLAKVPAKSRAKANPKKPAGRPAGTRQVNKMRLTEGGLTVEQEAYCRGRVMGMSIEEAIVAMGGGVSVHTARTWESKNQAVRDRINELSAIAQKNAIIKTGLDREWVITRYMKVAEHCMQAEPVLDKEGTPTGEYQFNASGANAALRALGDTLGMFKPVEKKLGDEYENLSDDDIARIAYELAAQTGLLEAGARVEAQAGRQQVIEVQALPSPD